MRATCPKFWGTAQPDANCEHLLNKNMTLNALHPQAWFPSSCSHTISQECASEFISNMPLAKADMEIGLQVDEYAFSSPDSNLQATSHTRGCFACSLAAFTSCWLVQLEKLLISLSKHMSFNTSPLLDRPMHWWFPRCTHVRKIYVALYCIKPQVKQTCHLEFS